MAKLRHLAIATNDPRETAEFYKQAFGFWEVHPVDGELAQGYFLSDGTITLAVLKFKGDQLGRGMDYTGLHHIGFVVENLDETGQKLEQMGYPCFMPKPEHSTSFFEIKHRGPDGVVIDISDVAWPGGAGLEDVSAPKPASVS
jgi:catechol 2,3-dioxygenase-like lactoylglutathione lyase family enzyme